VTGTSRNLVRILASVCGIAVGLLWWMTDPVLRPDVGTMDVLLFALAAAVMELLPMRQPGGRPIASSVAVTGAAAVLGMAPPVVALVAVVGWVMGRLVDRSSASLASLLIRGIGGWALSGLAAAGVLAIPAVFEGVAPAGVDVARLQLGAAVAVSVAVVLGRPALEELVEAEGPWRFVLRRIPEAVSVSWLVGFALASTAVLGALVHPVLGHWTLPTMLIPLFAARVGLDRFAVAARAYDQTIRAMSRLPEQLGTVTEGHGIRVAQVARDVGLELGLDAATLTDLERAAHLHELGRIRVELDVPTTRRELATAGASVIHETSSLDRVARIVAAHGDPSATAAVHDDVRLPARIIAACCDIDRYAPDPTDAGQRHEALLRLVRDIGDLEVIAALGRVLDRRVAQGT
jgi:hypothetical protein